MRLLWQICQIPDFRKTLTDAHLHLLATVFKHLTGRRGVLPNDWVGNMIAQLEHSTATSTRWSAGSRMSAPGPTCRTARVG